MRKISVEEAFGEVLKELRTERHISQENLAFESELDRTFISLLERGLRQPSLITILDLSKALKIHPNELFSKVTSKLNIK